MTDGSLSPRGEQTGGRVFRAGVGSKNLWDFQSRMRKVANGAISSPPSPTERHSQTGGATYRKASCVQVALLASHALETHAGG